MSKKPSKKASRIGLIQRPQHQFLPALLVVAGISIVGISSLVATFAATPQEFAASTDTSHYPKQLVAVSTPAVDRHAAVADSSDDSVISSVPASKTNGSVSLYDAGPGESKEALYSKLKGEKLQGLVNPDQETVTADDLVDGSGATGGVCWADITATGECWAWQNLGHSHPQVYFVDHTSAQWPVAQATYQWNEAHGIDSWYVWGKCPALSGIHCVPVYDGNYGNTGWDGLTTMTYSGDIMTSASIKLNDYYNSHFAGDLHNASLAAACHEEGHALGMGHNHLGNSCLFPELIPNATTPNKYDYDLLATIYSIHR